MVTTSTKAEIAALPCSQAVPFGSLTLVALTSHQLPPRQASIREQVAGVTLLVVSITQVPQGTTYRSDPKSQEKDHLKLSVAFPVVLS